mgnify:FL=1
MRKYYIYYWADFANTYNLLYAEPGDPIPDDAERITRTEAVQRCRENKALEECGCGDPYKPTEILPAAVVCAPDYQVFADHPFNRGYTLRGYIWERLPPPQPRPAFYIPTVDNALRRDYLAGKITVQEARAAFIRCGRFHGGESVEDTYRKMHLLPDYRFV